MRPDIHDVEQLVTALFTVKDSLERAARHSPQASTLAVLQVIAAHPGVNPKAIAIELNLHPSSITRQVQGLEDEGYVAVEVNKSDRRSCCIKLTERGQQEVERLTRLGMERFALFVKDWEAEEVQTLARLLVKLETSKAEIARHERQTKTHSWQQDS